MYHVNIVGKQKFSSKILIKHHAMLGSQMVSKILEGNNFLIFYGFLFQAQQVFNL